MHNRRNAPLHRFASISYIHTNGLLATYHPDFLVQTAEATYMIETKGQDKLRDRNVQQKRSAAVEWCAKLNALLADQRNGRQRHCVIVGEDAFTASLPMSHLHRPLLPLHGEPVDSAWQAIRVIYSPYA